MSVTSSGRSSTSTTIRWHSGLFWVIALAMSCRIVVLPAFGGDTISARWPLPIGMIRSMTRVVSRSGVVSRRSRWFGYSGVSLVKSGRFLASSTGPPLTVSRRTSGLNFCRWLGCSPSLGTRTAPVMASPRRRPFLRTMFIDT